MTTTEAVRRWDELVAYLQTHWLNPDLIPLRVALAQYMVHWDPDAIPAWSFILGPPGSAKSSIVIRALKYLPSVHSMDLINASSFISGWGKEFGLLPSLAITKELDDGSSFHSGVIVFSDFSTFLGMDPKDRQYIQDQLRVIYDGAIKKNVGNLKAGDQPDWQGKVTIVAACTTELESYWNLHRELGERFVFCRMRDRSQDEIHAVTAQALAQQMNGSKRSTDEYGELVKRFVDIDNVKTARSTDYASAGLIELAELVARARGKVKRDMGKVSDVAEIEYPTRLVQELGAVAMGNAMLMRRDHTIEQDYRLAITVGRNSIPKVRHQILTDLAQARANGYLLSYEFFKAKVSTDIALNRALEDLQVLGLVQMWGDPPVTVLTPFGIHLCERARMAQEF